MFVHVVTSDQEQVTAWTAFLFGFHMLLRKSNLVPDSQPKFDPTHQLTRECVCVSDNAIVTDISWSKTLQYKQKILPIPLVQLESQVMCPVFWVKKMLSMVPAKASDPFFCYRRGRKLCILTYPRLTYWLDHWTNKAGIDKVRYTSHCFRRGAASFLAEANISGRMIQLLRNWASECYLRYVDISLNKRVDAVCMFASLLTDN